MGFTFNNRELIVNVNIDEVKVAGGLDSAPPSGKCRVVNIYYDPVTQRYAFQREDQPEP